MLFACENLDPFFQLLFLGGFNLINFQAFESKIPHLTNLTDAVGMPNSGRELFLADASLFVDDAEAFDSYIREEEPETVEEASGSSQQVMRPFACV